MPDEQTVSIKLEPPQDSRKANLYFLGPNITADSLFPYLVEFATDVPSKGPLMMDVATLPKPKLITKILSDTVINYARSRTSQFLTEGAPDVLDDQQNIITPVDLSLDLLEEPRYITQAKTFAESLTRLSDLWKQKRSMAVHQKILESWAINIIYNAAGLQIGGQINRLTQSKIKQAAQALMPVLGSGQVHGVSSSTLQRTQYYWALLAQFRSNGIPFIVAYRPSTVDTLLLSDSSNRLKAEDIPPWIQTIQAVERHVIGWFDAIEGGKGRSDLESLMDSMISPSRWASPYDRGRWSSLRRDGVPNPLVPCPASALGIAKFGYDGFMSRRKIWSVMELSETHQSIAIADIPEASFLGIVPGVLRFSLFRQEGGIPGPDGVWLDTRQSQGSLAKIALGSKEQNNTVLAWHIASDCWAPSFQTAWVLAFSSRPIEIFQQLVRWDGIVLAVTDEQV